MSAHLQWMVVRNCSSFLIKRHKQTYGTEPNNLKALNSFHYKGLIHHKTVGVESAADGKGVVVVMKRRSGSYTMPWSSGIYPKDASIFQYPQISVIYIRKLNNKNHISIDAGKDFTKSTTHL
uniref:Large ribosomal subunit protein eL28 n=1 Tax=Sus scrofa TaxID=9823 RepID=A0A8D1WLB7_PIG